jgi:PrgI family protein
MSQYKVIQDIEAEDKLLGPFSLRQFIYAIITIALLFIAFQITAAGAWFVALPLLAPAGFFGLLAAPFGHDQSSEVWLLAKIRFMLKPRKRIWDQSGAKQLVTITVPKRIEKVLTDGLSQYEVKSRLSALATTLDSRGWAAKNVNINMFTQPSYLSAQDDGDRLIAPSALPQDVPQTAITAQDDIMDSFNNPTAQNFSNMIQSASQTQRQQAVAAVQNPAPAAQPANPQDFWFSKQGTAVPANDSVLAQQLATQKQKAQTSTNNMHKLQPIAKQTAVPPTPDPAILQLASNDDLNVATLAREAQKTKPASDSGEVVISLR